ncbi:hypothetical protein [Clostridium botulinum]|uniref:hypothetical protein n=1 Tax=Clostridium botulinum TaxID=1491 RepID=UPI0013FC95FA|nr:hypothetical protein [Clostridium botulinum]MBN1065414.1 hypothetical protein [Clostridium botulinum]NFO48411.1 hypothetical protein [Clostridium botulinum]
MRFNLETSKLLYEVRYRSLISKEGYTYEQLYRDVNGKYFIHFMGGKNSEYAVKTSYTDSVGRESNYFIEESKIDSWKRISNHMKEEYSNEFSIIDWQKEEEESLVWEPYIPIEELPF